MGLLAASVLLGVVFIALLQRAGSNAAGRDALGSAPSGRDAITVVAGVVEQRTGDFSAAPTAGLTVVRVSVSACGSRSSGSGFVAGDGVILTAAHVVGDAGLVRVDIGSRVTTGEVLGRFADGRDVAVISIDTGSSAVPVAGTVPPVGRPVTMIGRPAGGPRTVSVGARVDPLASTAEAVDGRLIGVASPSGRGFSGGPAVDADGGLIGMVVAAEVGTGTTIVVPVGDPVGLSEIDLVPNTCTPLT